MPAPAVSKRDFETLAELHRAELVSLQGRFFVPDLKAFEP